MDFIAGLLGYQKVGWIFSQSKHERDFIMHTNEVLQVAAMQVRYVWALGFGRRRAWVLRWLGAANGSHAGALCLGVAGMGVCTVVRRGRGALNRAGSEWAGCSSCRCGAKRLRTLLRTQIRC